jgi:anti-sigma factor RsiW
VMHRWASRRLSAHLDGELSPRAAGAVGRHAAGCPVCAALLDGLRRAQVALRAAAPSAPPPEAWSRLRERMAMPGPPAAGDKPAADPRRRAHAWVLAAAAAVLLAMGASLYVAVGPRPPAPVRSAPSFVTTADLVEEEAIPLSPSIELVLVAQQNGGAGPGEDR